MKLHKISNFYALLIVCGSSFLMLVGFLTTYNPDNVGFLVTLVPLLLVWLFLVSLLRLAAHAISRKENTLLKITSFIVPSVIVLSLMFSALGEVSILDALLLFVLAALGNFYLVRTWPK